MTANSGHKWKQKRRCRASDQRHDAWWRWWRWTGRDKNKGSVEMQELKMQYVAYSIGPAFAYNKRSCVEWADILQLVYANFTTSESISIVFSM